MRLVNTSFFISAVAASCASGACADVGTPYVCSPLSFPTVKCPKPLLSAWPCRSFINEEKILLEAARVREIGPLLNPALPKATDLFIIGPFCKGILPPCIKVTSKDYLKYGQAIRAYRRASKKCELATIVLCEPKVICTKLSRCCNLPFERFLEAVIETVRLVSCGRIICLSRFAKEIIERIYIAGIKNNSSCEQLIIFTATALHNLYLFNCFPIPSESRAIGHITRGLMQWLSEQGYCNLNSISVINYLNTPNLLDLYTAETINDEFTAYLKYYNNDQLFGVNAFIYTVKAFNPREAPLVNLQSAAAVLRGTYRPCNDLERRTLRRFQLYYVLTAKIFNLKERNIARVFEN